MNNTVISSTALSSTKVFLWRSLLKIKAALGQMIFDSVVAIISMLLFTFLFGGAIDGSYELIFLPKDGKINGKQAMLFWENEMHLILSNKVVFLFGLNITLMNLQYHQ